MAKKNNSPDFWDAGKLDRAGKKASSGRALPSTLRALLAGLMLSACADVDTGSKAETAQVSSPLIVGSNPDLQILPPEVYAEGVVFDQIITEGALEGARVTVRPEFRNTIISIGDREVSTVDTIRSHSSHTFRIIGGRYLFSCRGSSAVVFDLLDADFGNTFTSVSLFNGNLADFNGFLRDDSNIFGVQLNPSNEEPSIALTVTASGFDGSDMRRISYPIPLDRPGEDILLEGNHFIESEDGVITDFTNEQVDVAMTLDRDNYNFTINFTGFNDAGTLALPKDHPSLRGFVVLGILAVSDLEVTNIAGQSRANLMLGVASFPNRESRGEISVPILITEEGGIIVDAGVPDGAPAVDAAPPDAALEVDANALDAAVPDTALPDAAAEVDANAPDAAPPDSAPAVDANVPDAEQPDSGAELSNEERARDFLMSLLSSNYNDLLSAFDIASECDFTDQESTKTIEVGSLSMTVTGKSFVICTKDNEYSAVIQLNIEDSGSLTVSLNDSNSNDLAYEAIVDAEELSLFGMIVDHDLLKYDEEGKVYARGIELLTEFSGAVRRSERQVKDILRYTAKVDESVFRVSTGQLFSDLFYFNFIRQQIIQRLMLKMSNNEDLVMSHNDLLNVIASAIHNFNNEFPNAFGNTLFFKFTPALADQTDSTPDESHISTGFANDQTSHTYAVLPPGSVSLGLSDLAGSALPIDGHSEKVKGAIRSIFSEKPSVLSPLPLMSDRDQSLRDGLNAANAEQAEINELIRQRKIRDLGSVSPESQGLNCSTGNFTNPDIQSLFDSPLLLFAIIALAQTRPRRRRKD